MYAELKKPGTGRAFISFQKSEVSWNRLRTVYVDRLHEIEVPTLIVHGTKDRLVPLDCARQAHELIKDSQLHVLADCGHWPQREKPDEFNRVLLQFLVRWTKAEKLPDKRFHLTASPCELAAGEAQAVMRWEQQVTEKGDQHYER